MKVRNAVLIIGAITILVSCKKDPPVVNNKPDTGKPDTTKPVVIKKDTIFYLTRMITKFLDSPLPSSKTDTFGYDNGLLVKHHIYINYPIEKYSVTYNLKYEDRKLVEITRAGGKPTAWYISQYTYGDKWIKYKNTYKYQPSDSVILTLNNSGRAVKWQGKDAYYLFTYDAKGNVAARVNYATSDPTKPYFNDTYTYDNKHSPFTAVNDSYWLRYHVFYEVDSYINNKQSMNGMFIDHTYNKSGYPTKAEIRKGPVVVTSINYQYRMVIKDK